MQRVNPFLFFILFIMSFLSLIIVFMKAIDKLSDEGTMTSMRQYYNAYSAILMLLFVL